MCKVHNLVSNNIAWGIEELNRFYRKGLIRGLQFQFIQPDGQFVTGRCGWACWTRPGRM